MSKNTQTTFQNNGEIVSMQADLEANLIAVWAVSVIVLFSSITANSADFKSTFIKRIVIYGLLFVSITILFSSSSHSKVANLSSRLIFISFPPFYRYYNTLPSNQNIKCLLH